MIPSEKQRLDAMYDRHVRALKLHGYSASTIDVYARAVRRLAAYFDCVPEHLSTEQLGKSRVAKAGGRSPIAHPDQSHSEGHSVS